ncbi:hypothetical protein [Methanoculleus chikugoensis]|uniref:coenzyme F420 hydrogenase/dehydrogenase beta subunit N-terminal domain-containing protein n=1 Tax=Methanoculleus chikugoensis TaxID=118126 RepID=UPI000B148F75|nr:coenzyme F420 hydrogenase/dehydrogenase beta subunit N-terminal domain-containing protein [Methanoculleus chikugoensis]
MAEKGDLLYAWTTDDELREKAETGGGAVTALLRHALESGMVDAVFAVRKGADVYDAMPAMITDPAEIGGGLRDRSTAAPCCSPSRCGDASSPPSRT